MTTQEAIRILRDNLQDLKEAERWLKRSYDQCTSLKGKISFEEKDYDAIEAFSSRFARTVDFLIHKVFKSLDKVELEESGTLIDVINRAHKRNIIDEPNEVRELKELRNEIVHEYSKTDITEHFNELIELSPRLFKFIDNTIRYCNKYL